MEKEPTQHVPAASLPPPLPLPPAAGSTLNINVGVLGHVDSGKTSLVKALSTILSTAALDKHPQSKTRGITLDLGFSAFTVDVPPSRTDLVAGAVSKIQFTLVDCPGHASLVRTVIGGAQIIDMMILVIDVVKGIQTQTAECLLIGEILTDRLIVVLNKVDMVEGADHGERDKRIEKTKLGIRKAFKGSRFSEAPIVCTAAAVGGGLLDKPKWATLEGASESLGVDTLMAELLAMVTLPNRSPLGPFYFAVDHCFPIKGQGTVCTGTVLRGAVKVNDVLEVVAIGQNKKVKSMQMFHKPVEYAMQGDRLGICLSGLDASSMERGILTSPGEVPSFDLAIAKASRIRYFRMNVLSGAKYHITIGYTTVMATTTFFSRPVSTASPASVAPPTRDGKGKGGGEVRFEWGSDYEYQEELQPRRGKEEKEKDKDKPAEEVEWWVLLKFEHSIKCPADSVVIGTRLDGDITENVCRIAFHGRIAAILKAEDAGHGLSDLKVFKRKEKCGTVDRVVDKNNVVGHNMFKKETKWELFTGMEIVTDKGERGRLESSFGKSGKFKVYFGEGTTVEPKDKLYLRFKKYIFDGKQRMVQ